ncbi:uncharacterized protein HGUI_03399 [Hanseniaspora guilliermondii]|uniref:SH3 domain-containing protein n=1 Tax=Hanseniaspora guilliermondii TaxID=56406 RepID=A0A1L0D250_9ASCO|nr:uncharacterized protein HGUI_03399 [Hanseniaspora guilliermondii]
MNIERIVRTIDGQIFTLTPITTVLQTTVAFSSGSHLLSTAITTTQSATTNPYSSLSATTQITSGSISKTLSASKATTTSHSFNLGTTANSDGVTETSGVSTKTGLIVGLSVGITVCLIVLITLIWYFMFRNKPYIFKAKSDFSESKWKNSNFSWNMNTDDDDYMMTKNYKVVKNVTTPQTTNTHENLYLKGLCTNKKSLKTPESLKKINDWKSHIFTPFKNSFISEIKQNEESVFDCDLEKNESLDESSDRSKYASSSSNDNLDVEKFLYCNPPKIKNISSEISSFKSIKKNKSQKIYEDLNLDSIQDTQSLHEKWTYTSPLSKWFLRDSTYLQDSHVTTPTDQILSVDLKTLQLPSKEKTITKKSSKVNLNTKRKHIIDINGMNRLSAIMHIKEKPLPKPPTNDSVKRLSRISLLAGSFHKTSSEAKKSRYMVIKSYTPQMLDELELVEGQIVKILSVHSDGWAMVTFDDIDSVDDAEKNDFTGVVPLVCLKKM